MEDIRKKRQRCERFTRIVGYVRRIDAWNYGKREEFKDRSLFDTPEAN